MWVIKRGRTRVTKSEIEILGEREREREKVWETDRENRMTDLMVEGRSERNIHCHCLPVIL